MGDKMCLEGGIPHDASTICPKCGYQRQPNDDEYYSKLECPKCGLIYSKFVPPPPPEPEHTLESGQFVQTELPKKDKVQPDNRPSINNKLTVLRCLVAVGILISLWYVW